MYNIIDYSFFWGALAINQNISVASTGLLSQVSVNKSSEFESYIEKYTRMFLVHNFGQDIADKFPVELEKYLKDEERKTSPIANLIYFHYMRDKQSIMTPTGNKVSTIKDTFTSNPSFKISSVWNEMAGMIITMHRKLRETERIDISEDEYIKYSENIFPNIQYDSPIFESVNVFNI